jgi:hypothetical protein
MYRWAFKCLVKTALAVMPPSEAGRCALKRWILEPKHTFESCPYCPLIVMIQLIPGAGPRDQISYVLLKRHDGADCPYMVFLLRFSQCVFQIILPMPEDDLLAGEERTFDMMHYPTMWENKQYIAAYGHPNFNDQDFSGCDPVRDEIVEVHLRSKSVRTTWFDVGRAAPSLRASRKGLLKTIFEQRSIRRGPRCAVEVLDPRRLLNAAWECAAGSRYLRSARVDRQASPSASDNPPAKRAACLLRVHTPSAQSP